MKRLAVLEAEVKAKADADRARKAAALAKLREQRAKQAAEREALSQRQAALVTKKKPEPRAEVEVSRDTDDDDDGIGSTLALAKKAHGVKQELQRAPKPGEKSWVKSGVGVASCSVRSAGSTRGRFARRFPRRRRGSRSARWRARSFRCFCSCRVLMVVMPLSGIAGALYAIQYNRKGARQRLFERKDGGKPKQLPGK